MMIRKHILLAVLGGAVCAQLGGCSTTVGVESVRVIYADLPHEQDKEARDIKKVSPDAQFAGAVVIGYGLWSSLEKQAREFATTKDADMVLIRPSVTANRSRAEAWRSSGFRPVIADEPAEPGRTLQPPPDTPLSKRRLNIEECYAEARARLFKPLAESDRVLLGSNDPRGFFTGYLPLIDSTWRPTKNLPTYLRVNNAGPALEDEYVVCLMRRGYVWPSR